MKAYIVCNNPGSVEVEKQVAECQVTPFESAVSIAALLTTKGDTFIRDASGLVRNPVGSDGQVEVADSTSLTGKKWTATSDQGGVTLTNKSGVDVTTGAVVIQYTSTAECFTTTTANADGRVIGVTAENIDDNASGKVLIKGGVGAVLVAGTVAIGNRLCSSTTAMRAHKAGVEEKAFATALTANASGNGTVTAILDFPELLYKLLGHDDAVTAGGIDKDYMYFQKFTAVKNGVLTELRHKAYGSGNMKFAIYADNAGEPGALLTSSASAAVAAGWNAINFPQWVIEKDANYWLACNSDTLDTIGRFVDATVPIKYKVVTYTDPFPNPPSGLGTQNWRLLIAGFG